MPQDPTLLGRESQVGLLAQLLDEAPTHGAALLVRGEPGVGKSALLSEAIRYASDRGIPVLRTTGHQSEAQMPFSGLHQLIRPVLTRISELPAAQRKALEGAFGSGRDTHDMDLFLVALATLSVLSDCAGRSSLLLVADDAHWLDPPSRQVLEFVARRLESDSIVLLIAMRDGFGTEIDQSGLPEMRVTGLEPDAAEALLDREADYLPGPIRTRLLAEADGNPLAIRELPIAWRLHTGRPSADALPLTERLEQAFAARAGDLPAATRATLLIAALNDEDSLADALQASARLTASEITLDDLAPAETAHLIEVDEFSLRFRHPLIRSALSQVAGLAERQAAHAALAWTLADYPDRAVWHAAAATVGTDARIADQLETTAMRAQRRGAVSVALAALRRAVQLTADPKRRGERLLAAAELASALARDDEVAELLSELEPLDLTTSDRHKMVWFREFLADVTGGGSIESMVACARRLAEDGQEEFALNPLLSAALKCHWIQPDDVARESVATAASELPLARDDARLLGIYALATPATRGEMVIDLISGITPADLLHQIHDESKAFEAMRQYAMALTVTPDNQRSQVFREAAITGLRQQGRLARLTLSLGAQAQAAFTLGDWPLAAQAAEESLRLAREIRQPTIEGSALLTLAAVAAIHGSDAEAEDLTRVADRILASYRPRWPFPKIEVVRANTALARGSYAEAFERCRRIFDPGDISHHWQTNRWAVTLMNLADAAVYSGNVETAKRVLAGLTGPRNSLEFRWGTAYAAAVLADDDGDKRFASAFTSAPASVYAHARLHLAYGTRLRRERRISDSRHHLRSAIEGFDAVQAAPWYERARQELRASGETSRARVAATRDDLSPQEIQIAMLAADGLTNREIGAKLFVSHRTVGSHLYHIFPKLSITSRSELREAMRQFSPPRDEQDAGR